MKILLCAFLFLIADPTFSAPIITVEAYGSDFGASNAIIEAKKECVLKAEEICKGPVKQIGEWQAEVIRRVEGYMTAYAKSQFECTSVLLAHRYWSKLR